MPVVLNKFGMLGGNRVEQFLAISTRWADSFTPAARSSSKITFIQLVDCPVQAIDCDFHGTLWTNGAPPVVGGGSETPHFAAPWPVPHFASMFSPFMVSGRQNRAAQARSLA